MDDHRDPKDITGLLKLAAAGDRTAESEVLVEIYDELHRLARAILGHEQQGRETLRATVLVNEAYLRLLRGSPLAVADRLHFFRLAAKGMRAILVDHARRRASAKRGAGQPSLPLNDDLKVSDEDCDLVLRIHQALERLTEIDSRQGQVVELRFFGGLSEHEVASVLGISERTVKRDWTVAKSWLHAELSA